MEKLSSFEKLLLGIDQPPVPEVVVPLRKGQLCPQCKKGELNYNCLLQLECNMCGFTSGGGEGCT